jgi:hypothetical protein
MTLSWLGLAEDAIGGMGRQGAVGLFHRGYHFGSDAKTLVGVPVQVWSMKGFSARWHGQATAGVVEAKLESTGTDRLRGSVTNRLGMPLEDCVLAFGRKVYPLGNLPANGSVSAESRTTEDLRGHLSRRASGFVVAQPTGRSSKPANQFSPSDLIFAMMFHARLPEGNHYAANEYFSDIDLSELLEHQRAILVARVPAAGSKLILNGEETTTNVNTASFLRVILSVTPSGNEPEPVFAPGDLRR